MRDGPQSTGSRPVLGQTQVIAIGNVPNGLAFMHYGFSNRQLGAFTLPLDLTTFALPGCWLLQSLDVFAAPCTSTGPTTAQHSLLIPNVAAFVGVQLFLQAWAPAPGANGPGLVNSNGVALTVGGI